MFKWIDRLKHKHIRLILGIIMMYSFIFLALSLFFFIGVAIRFEGNMLTNYLLVMFGFPNFWLPSVILIVFCYFLLTRVWKYKKEEVDK